MKRWLLFFLFLNCGALRGERLFVTTHPAMGTEFKLYLYASNKDQATQISDAVFDEVDRMEEMLSNYRETSELSRINRMASEAPVRTDPEMMDFLKQSEFWSRASDGAFDITVGPLMQMWGFFQHKGRVPSDAELESIRPLIDWKNVVLDTSAQTVHFTVKGIGLDPGGIGKGFAVDAAVRVLRAWHVGAAMLSAGSSTLYAMGAPPHHAGWRVIVSGPSPSHQTLSTILLHDTSLSSANCSEKNFVKNGTLYCHIMNPKTLRSVVGRVQVAVVHPSATASDALSNVLFVQSPSASVEVLRKTSLQSRALILSRDAHGKISCVQFRWGTPVQHLNCQLP